ncbi:low temperature requirement protein A [Kitasatospora camelliae]|uniref:Low temperature requirement protein A n=1 Tax=Kitasatospora camelliae TaxID=3156397 RepID=A0AAU8K527_9ACTN
MTAETAGGPRPAGERHASWTELFFDLVVVAGVLQLSHLLHDGPAPGDLALYALLYLAFWTTWVCFTVYGNIEARQEWDPSLVVAMLGLAVMVAAVPDIRTEHAVAFAVSYVVLRWLGGRASTASPSPPRTDPPPHARTPARPAPAAPWTRRSAGTPARPTGVGAVGAPGYGRAA